MKEIETLRTLGLTEYESKIFLVLLQYGTLNVKEILCVCNVPRNKIYESLQNMIKKGIVEFLPTIPKKYLIKNISSLNFLLEDKQKEVENIKKGIIELKKVMKNKSPISNQEIVWIDYGHEAFVNKIKDAISKTKNENFIVARKIRIDPVILRLSETIIKKGAKIYMIFPESDPSLKDWLKIGAKIKLLDRFSDITFSTFDEFLCRLNLDLNNLNDPTLWIENPDFIKILKENFKKLWKRGKIFR
jgi:sugar-specific transcriptional regulator TrmB